jgi:hypothetical protein
MIEVMQNVILATRQLAGSPESFDHVSLLDSGQAGMTEFSFVA